MGVEVDMNNNYVTHSIRRTGHARFRRGPADESTTSTSSYSEKKLKLKLSVETQVKECKSANSSVILLSAGEEATVSNAKLREYCSAKPPSDGEKWRCISTDTPKCYSSAKPPLPSSHRKRRREIEQVSVHRLSSHACHCCKTRKKIEISRRIRISKGSSIPSDDYSWKKYDHKLVHKLVTGSPSRGGYYKCSSVTGCSARKHVIKDKNDPMLLIITYKGEHNHQEF